MPIEVKADGTFRVDTVAEALELQRALAGTAPTNVVPICGPPRRTTRDKPSAEEAGARAPLRRRPGGPPTGQGAEVVAFLQSHGPSGWAPILEALGAKTTMEKQTLRSCVNRLGKAGHVKRLKNGDWTLSGRSPRASSSTRSTPSSTSNGSTPPREPTMKDRILTLLADGAKSIDDIARHLHGEVTLKTKNRAWQPLIALKASRQVRKTPTGLWETTATS